MFQVIEICQARGISKYFLTGIKEHTVVGSQDSRLFLPVPTLLIYSFLVHQLQNKSLPWDYDFRFVIEEISNINDKEQVREEDIDEENKEVYFTVDDNQHVLRGVLAGAPPGDQ